jgi:hypothetical protein
MTGFVVDQRRRAAIWAVLIALGFVYAASLAVFVRADRSAAGPSRIYVQPPVPIILSAPVRIGYGGCGECRHSGWGAPVADWTWTIKDTATLIFAAPTAPGLDARGLVLEIDAGAFLPGDARRTLRVTIGGEVVGEEQLLASDPDNAAFFAGGHFFHSFPVPGKLVTSNPTVLIELHMASIGSPRDHEWSTDRRKLGVAVRSVAFRPAD